MKKIFITGGHFTPALAVIDELKRRGGWEIFYVGRKMAMEGEKALALEYQELIGRTDVHYLVITAGRLQSKFMVRVGQSIRALVKTPVGFIQASYWLLRYRPNVILSFGGYLAVPVVLAGWLLDIPVVTHEQTLVPGRANQLISYLAKKVLVAWPDGGNHIFTGNPIREEFRRVKVEKSPKLSNIFITGGSQGSHWINLAVGEVIGELVEKYRIVHQTGETLEFKDYEKLSQFASDKYIVSRFFTPAEQTRQLAKADLVICRAGANTIFELSALEKVALLVPLAGTGRNEQVKNAERLASFGGAVIVRDTDLTGEKLLELINLIARDWKVYQKGAGQARKLVVWDAAKRIVNEVEEVS